MKVKMHRAHSLTLFLSLLSLVAGLALVPFWKQSEQSTLMPQAPSYEGFHDSVDCNYIKGWVWDRNNAATHFEVTVYDGVVPVASGIANQGRLDLNRGSNDYGFVIPTPARIKDGQQHSISVKITGTNISLGNTPRPFNSTTSGCGPTGPTPVPAYEGFHDWVDCNYAGGWARDNNNPNAQLTVLALDETGAVLGTTTASLAYGSVGNHGFGIALPERVKDGFTHSITVKVLNSVFNLANTPRSFNSASLACSTPSPSPTPALPPPGTITMTVRARTPESKNYNFRVQMGNPTISFTPASATQPAKYHAYGNSGIDTWRWNSDNPTPSTTSPPYFQTNYITGYPIQTRATNCAYGTDPRLWDARCTSDSLGYFWKQIDCPSTGSSSVACEDNDRWNGWPGTFNITTFSSPAVWPNLFSQGFGTKDFSNVINAAKLNSIPIQPAANDCLRSADTVWVDDILPANAIRDGNESWSWTYATPAPSIEPSRPQPVVSAASASFSPPPFPSVVSHQSSRLAGTHQHFFYNAVSLEVNAGDTLFAYVYIDPNSPPRELMLQWNDGTWEHRAYWGANKITSWGTNATPSRWWVGNLPPAGQWVRLEVPANKVGLEGHTVNGMAFTLFDGQATWDRAGKSTPVTSTICPPKLGTSPANSFHAYNPDQFATGADYPAVVQVKYSNGATRWFMAFNRMIKWVSTTYQSQSGPVNESEYGTTAADSWQVMWATSADGANWTIHPQMLLRSVNEGQKPWLGVLVQDMIVDEGFFYLLVQDMVHPYLYLVRAPVDVFSSNGPGYVQNEWRIASYPIKANGEYTWQSFPMGVPTDFDLLGAGAYPVMRSQVDPAAGFVKRSTLGRVFSSSSPGASLYLGVTNDWGFLELWRTASLSKPFTYESNLVIEDPSFTGSDFSFRYGFTHYADNTVGSPRILSSGFDWWMAEDLRGSGFGHTTSPNPQDGYSTAGRHTAYLSGF